MKIPTEEIEFLDDGTYRVSVGNFHAYTTSAHLIVPKVNQLRRKYKEEFDRVVQPYMD